MGEKEENKKEGGGGEKKEAAGPTAVVLKVDIHCEGCARKFKKLLKSFPGVDAVSADMANNKLTVVGNVDPLKIREHVGSRTGKKVDLLSPQPKKDKESEPKKAQSDPKDQKKPEEKKPKPPVSTTVGVKIRLHCDGCIQRIRKIILRFKGVESVSVDSQKDLVTVKGTMDVKELIPYLKEKLKRNADVVGEKDAGGGGGENKDKPGNVGDGEDKKKEKGKGDQGGDKKKEAVAVATELANNKMEYYGPPYGGYYVGGGVPPPYGGGGGGGVPPPYGGGYYYGGGGVGMGYGYRTETVAHPPQMFSDENPNACSVM